MQMKAESRWAENQPSKEVVTTFQEKIAKQLNDIHYEVDWNDGQKADRKIHEPEQTV